MFIHRRRLWQETVDDIHALRPIVKVRLMLSRHGVWIVPASSPITETRRLPARPVFGSAMVVR